MKSLSLQDKLSLRLNDDPIMTEFDSLLEVSTSNNRFVSVEDLQSHLVEGAILNVGKIASKALAIPNGDYMVWMTDAGHTMLVPISGGGINTNEVFEHSSEQYDIFTNTLLQNWNKLQRTLTEATGDQDNEDNTEEQDSADDQGEEEKNQISTNIDISTVDRLPILRAMNDRGHTVTSLADAVGVDPPAISRILRTPKDVQGDPGGRNPSMGLASQICGELRLDPTSAFPDIFGSQRYEARKVKGNRGSGMSNAAAGSTKKGKASKKWTQGSK